MKSVKSKVIAIVGPTASGKSILAVKLAQKFGGEIISADSRQVYKGMDIGTGKVTKKEMAGIVHHLLDVISPKKTFTASHYQKLGNIAIKKILKKKKLPIIVGGTGLYVDTLINGNIFPAVKPNMKLRKQFDKLTAEHLFKMLRKLDPERTKTIDRYNKRRLVRALEIIFSTGKPVPKLETDSNFHVLKIGLKPDDKELKKLIRKRLLARIKKGLIEEVRKLHNPPPVGGGLSWKRLDDLGLEYRWVSRYLRGLISKDEMINTLEKEIWRYAKRQMTWFKRDQAIYWPAGKKQIENLLRQFLREDS